MAASREQALEALKKAHAKTRRGSKNKKTIARENYRQHYEEAAQEHFAELTEEDFKYAKKPANWKARAGVREQLIGKPKERFEGEIKGELDLTLKKAIEKIYGKKEK